MSRGPGETLSLVLVMVVLFTAGDQGSREAEGSEGAAELSLRVETDRREFLPGEPVLVGLSFENRGSEVFEDFSSLKPKQGFIKLSLSRGGKKLPWTGRQETWLFTKEGMSLEPGAGQCDLFDLLECFGTRSSLSLSGKIVRFRFSLPPGIYTLRTRFHARMGVRKDLTAVIVDANELEFEVRDASAVPSSEHAALELLETSPSHNAARSPSNRWSDVQSSGVRQSRYLAALAREYVPLADSVDILAFATAYVSRGGGRLAATKLLRSRYELFGGHSDSDAWLRRVTRDDTSGLFTCFLRTWEQGALQARKYGRGRG